MSLEEVMKKINKDFKSGVCNVGIEFDEVRRIPFSSPALNYMTYGGIPVGRIVEFCGAESCAKSTTVLDICGNAQRLFPDKKVLYVDVEQTLDPEWAAKLNADASKMIVYSPPEGATAERIFQDTKDLVESGEISIAVIDSLGAMVSAQAYSKSIEDRTYGGISMALTNFSKQMIPVCTRTGCTLIGINQVREDMNSAYGGTTTTGGRAWRHSCTIRLEFRKGQFVDEKNNPLTNSCENPAGTIINVALVKSKICRLDRKVGKFILKYLEGIDYISDIIDLGIRYGRINAAGAWFTIMDKETGEIFKEGDVLLKFQGKAKLAEFLKGSEEWQEKLVAN